MKASKSLPSIDTGGPTESLNLLTRAQRNAGKVPLILSKAQMLYNSGRYTEALEHCEVAYNADAFRTDNLLLMGAIHFQLRNFSESIFYNQQCIRVDPNFAEAFSNLGNALKELGDIKAAIQFYLKVTLLITVLVIHADFIHNCSPCGPGDQIEAAVL
jgi:tetratricopeptide (TPR) repeat protein